MTVLFFNENLVTSRGLNNKKKKQLRYCVRTMFCAKNSATTMCANYSVRRPLPATRRFFLCFSFRFLRTFSVRFGMSDIISARCRPHRRRVPASLATKATYPNDPKNTCKHCGCQCVENRSSRPRGVGGIIRMARIVFERCYHKFRFEFLHYSFLPVNLRSISIR